MLQPPYKGTLSRCGSEIRAHCLKLRSLHTHTLTRAESPRAAAMNRMNAEETLRRAETPLFWVGAFTVASLALWLLYRLLSGFRIWVLGNGKLLSPKLGRWAGESGHITFHGHGGVRGGGWGGGLK